MRSLNSTATTSSTSISAAPSSRPTLTATWPSGRGGRRSMCSATATPQVVVGRYADVHKVFSDTETFASEMPRGPGWEQFNKIMDAQFVTQMDGEQHARVRRLLMPAFSSRRIAQLQESITGDRRRHARPHRGERSRLRRHEGLRRASRRRCLAQRHDGHGRAPQGGLHRVPRSHSRHHLRQAGRAVVAGAAAGLRPHHGGDQGHHRRAARQRRARTSSAISSTRATPATSSTTASCSTRFSASAARRCRPPAAPPAERSYLLYTHDDQRNELIRDPSLIPDAIEECLRLGSNGYFTFPRIATRDTEVGGTRIFKGMVVRPSPLAPNYDPDVFPDPLRFDIHRKPKRILSFGAGPHHCVGNILGRTTITIAIHAAAGALSGCAHQRS